MSSSWVQNICLIAPVLAIIIFTVIIKLLTYPLTKKQLIASKKMQEMQPKLSGTAEKIRQR